MPRRDRVAEAAERRLLERGQRWTPARRSIIAALEDAEHPRTVPELCAAGSDLKVSSVYRNLTVLEDAGIVHRIEAGEHARYELAEDLSQHHHHHLLCAGCGRVEDFEPGGTVEQRAVDGLARAARKLGWEVTGHRLDVVGRCAACRLAGDRRGG